MNGSNSCCTCGKSKANLNCGICGDSICKKCTQFLPEDSFSFYKKVPAELSHTTYCQNCYEAKVAGPLAEYQNLMERAREVLVFEKKQGKETRLIKRLEEPVEVAKCSDYDEIILRLAFFAAQLGYNAIVDADIVAKKVQNGSRQTTEYSGKAVPANVSEGKLLKDRSFRSNPN